MENIALAKNTKFIPGENKNQGKIEISPLFPGYGITLGNSVRRVLLASLIGAAPIGIKIKGVNHEFTSIPHIKEDILEIVLNLKKLRLKSFSEEIVKLELDVHGKKKITVADINENSEVEIANKDLRICEITDMAGNLNMEILIAKGRGYDTIEGREGAGKKNKDINYIEMDSIFTPVLKVGINMENVRVGKMTNWDKLIIDLETDGTLSPEEAYEEAIRILIKQFKAVEKIGGSSDAEASEDKPKEKESVETQNSASEEESVETQNSASKKEEKKPKKKPGRPKKS